MINKIKSRFRKLTSDDRANFRLSIGFKFSVIPIISLLFAYFLNYIALQVILISFSVFKADKDFLLRDLLNTFVIDVLLDVFPWALGFFVLMFVLGMFIAKLMLRPFDVIGSYCEGRLEEREVSYDPEFSADLKLLSSFSDWFFSTIDIVKESGGSGGISVPAKYKKIHKPVFETAFFLNYLLIIIIISIITATGIHYGCLEIYESLVEVVGEVYSAEQKVKVLTTSFYQVFWMTSNFVIVLSAVFYLYFLLHLYSKISTPAFGIFATMRSFISGRSSSRVHLIGFPYVRNQTRILNKYLEKIEKEIISKK